MVQTFFNWPFTPISYKFNKIYWNTAQGRFFSNDYYFLRKHAKNVCFTWPLPHFPRQQCKIHYLYKYYDIIILLTLVEFTLYTIDV